MNATFEKNDIKFRIHTRRHMPYYAPSFHSHAEIIHILSGELRVSVNGIQKTLLPGDTSITLPYVIHSYEESRDFEAIVLMFDPSVANLYEKKLITYKHINPFLSQNKEIPVLLKKILGFYESDKKDDLHTNIYLQALIGEIFLSVQENTKENVDANTIQKVLIYCSEHYTEDITVRKVSEDLFISQSTVTKIFSGKLSSSFRDYINGLRISKAKFYLEKTDKKIIDIMYSCGFKNQSSFNRIFYEICGMTPTECRKKLV